MNNGNDKIYLGNCKEKHRRNGDKFLTGLINLDAIDGEALADHIFVGDNGNRYLRIIINPYAGGPNHFGQTHSIAVDVFKPDGSRGNNQSQSGNYGNNSRSSNNSYGNSRSNSANEGHYGNSRSNSSNAGNFSNNRSGSTWGSGHSDSEYNQNRSSDDDQYNDYDLG